MNIQRALNRTAAAAAFLLVGILGLLGALSGIAARADTPNLVAATHPSAAQTPLADMLDHRCHIYPVQQGYGVRAPGGPGITRPDCDDLHRRATASPTAGPAATDLNDHGGPVITSALSTIFFLNCPSNCLTDWGDPLGFLSDLYASNFIHNIDQYMRGATKASGRYTVNGSTFSISSSQPHTILDSQLRTLILNQVKAMFPGGGGGGYNRMYTIFLPSGQDLCFDGAAPQQCYCPDGNCNGGTFVFCAYHGSFSSTDAIGQSIHIVYQAQPFANVGGCQVNGGPNGALKDSVNNVFSHEIFESITDPDLNAWWRTSDGSENGDICNFNEQNPFTLNGRLYSIQKEYSNDVHACVAGALRVVNPSHDFNFDGTSDILLQNTGGGVALWLMKGNGVIQSALGVASLANVWGIVGQRDLNGDGIADVLFRATDGSIGEWLMNNNGTILSVIGLGNPSTAWNIFGTGDFNNDGIGDILFRGGGTAVAIWYMNSSGGIGTALGIGSLPSSWVIAGTGDFDGDGVWDILWFNNTSGGIATWLMNANGTLKSAVGVGALPAGWGIAGTGDFNNDGISDILLSTPVANGTTVAIWFINSNGLVGSVQGVGTMASGWTIAQTGDLNSDGKADILWYNGTSGGIVTWLMNSNGTVSSQVALGSLPPSTWQLVNLNAD